MALFDELKKNAAGFTENMAKKTSTVIETQKLKMKKSALESDLRDCYVMLGTIYAKYLDAMEDEQLKGYDILSKVKTIRKELEHISDELLKAKGAVRCPKCGNEFPETYDFCPKCGEKIKEESLWDDVETVTVEVEDDAYEQEADAANQEADTDTQTDVPEADIVQEETKTEDADCGDDKTDSCNEDIKA